MSRPRSPRLIAALAAVEGGMTVYQAAKLYGLHQSSIHRTINPPVRPKCPCCGKTITKKTEDKRMG
ncbi:MAG: hypothetical protein KGI54_14190 [Pseudomonadota bacterium]|nr:hypothetical protein [Pseudomonadota bacterium]